MLLHGRDEQRLAEVKQELESLPASQVVETYTADLTDLKAVETMASEILAAHDSLDVLINNAGIFKTPNRVTSAGHDVRFVVNMFAPYRLTQTLLPLMDGSARIVNLSSAAQAPVELDALAGTKKLTDDMDAYAQSKLAITMWSRELASLLGDDGPGVFAVNPGSMLATSMVKQAFGVEGRDIGIGSDILYRAALSDEFEGASGQYFDNDAGQFGPPHTDAMDSSKSKAVIAATESEIDRVLSSS